MLSCFSHVPLFGTLWTVARQAPMFMGFSRQESWIGFPCPSPGGHPYLGNEPASPVSPALQADSLPTESPAKPKKRDTVILFSCYCIAWFWYQGYTDLRKLVEKSFFFYFLRSICEMNSSVKLWSNSPVSPYIPGLILVIFKRVNIQSLICLFRFSTFSCSLCFLIICPLKSTLYLFLWALFSIFLEFFLCRLIVMFPF